MKPLPTMIETAWLVTGPERDLTYLMLVRLETEDGAWRVQQWIGSGPVDETEHGDEAAARAHLARIYAAHEGAGRWKVRRG